MKSLSLKYPDNAGFTVIELIITIAIMAVLSGVVMYNVGIYMAKSRDARRRVDLEEARKALVMYIEDHGALPVSGFGYGGDGWGWATNYNNGTACYSVYGDLEDFLDGTDPDIPSPQKMYVKIGHDPKYGGCYGYSSNPGGYMYYHTSDNKCGVLLASLEKPTAEDLDTCSRSCYYNTDELIASYGMNYCVEVRTR